MFRAKFSLMAAVAATLTVAACGDDVANKKTAEQTPPADSSVQVGPERQAAEPAKPIEMTMIGMNGRWRSDKGSLGDDAFLLLDVTTEGDVSIEVRTIVDGKEAVAETTSGKASISGDVLKGTAVAGDGVHSRLEKYSAWTIDKSGKIKGAGADEALQLKKENLQ